MILPRCLRKSDSTLELRAHSHAKTLEFASFANSSRANCNLGSFSELKAADGFSRSATALGFRPICWSAVDAAPFPLAGRIAKKISDSPVLSWSGTIRFLIRRCPVSVPIQRSICLFSGWSSSGQPICSMTRSLQNCQKLSNPTVVLDQSVSAWKPH